ncbi:hypothetical protein BD289DRAFT_450715 [Coniella lustricola]|uniref:Uncharacterized protein n=1 Tax=Coniella lustricola TaxID=2025994 RepID=A0A2T3AHM9_9PEZI|nr:hypothetical protein BD289DRAFT_450715 [Coniella lustricola]
MHHLSSILAAVVLATAANLSIVQAKPIPITLVRDISPPSSSSVSPAHAALRLLHMSSPGVPILSPPSEQAAAALSVSHEVLSTQSNQGLERSVWASSGQVPLALPPSSFTSSALVLSKSKDIAMEKGVDEKKGLEDSDESPKAVVRFKHVHFKDDWEWQSISIQFQGLSDDGLFNLEQHGR